MIPITVLITYDLGQVTLLQLPSLLVEILNDDPLYLIVYSRRSHTGGMSNLKKVKNGIILNYGTAAIDKTVHYMQ
jgi:hypothetical protein